MAAKRVITFAVGFAVMFAIFGGLYARFKSAPSLLSITIVQLQVPHSGLLHIAHAKSYFAEEGLDVKVKTVLTGHEAISQVLDGQADVATTAETPFAKALAEGKSLKLIATIFSSRWSSGIVVRKDRGILVPSDLKGKRIGIIAGTNTHYDLETFLAFHGIPLDAVTLVPASPDLLASEMLAGDLDAVSIWIPFMTQITEKLGDKVDTFYPKEGYAQTFNLVVRSDYVSQHPQEVSRLLRALAKAEHFAQNQPDKTVEILAAASGVDTRALSGHSGSFAYELTLKQSLLISIENEVRWNYRRGFVPAAPFPDVLGAIETEPLRKIKPDSVTIAK